MQGRLPRPEIALHISAENMRIRLAAPPWRAIENLAATGAIAYWTGPGGESGASPSGKAVRDANQRLAAISA
eukprot:9494201-Pyramimonas_sp.AAC.1